MNLSEVFGKTLIDQLVKQGVTDFILAPGFRSTPLAIAIAEHPEVDVCVHFDERGAAFHALGRAKASGKPAAVIVTSGTAVGNLMPAVMEASTSQVPLILLTCDRPHELRETGANQTTDQVKLFGDFVRFQFDFPRPSHDLLNRFFATTVAEGVYKSQFPLPGPVQFNLPFPEPFFGQEQEQAFELEPVLLDKPLVLSSETLDLSGKRGVIVVGSGGSSSAVTELSKRLGWPIFADIISGHREVSDPGSIAHYHHILKALPELEVDTVIHVGGPYVSKVLLNWVAKQPEVIHVSPYIKRIDPHHVTSRRLASCDGIVGEAREGWIEQWQQLAEAATPSWEGLCEPAVIKMLADCPDALFFANSMPIRDADMFLFPRQRNLPIFANRGLSGIDGNIATICGIASKMPVTAVIGDQTALHDLNSLAQLRKTKYPVRLIIINNGGGGIFSFVAIGERKDLLDSYFAAAHDLNFEQMVHGFGLNYQRVETLEQLMQSEATVIEVITSRQQNHQLHQQIDASIKTQLCDSFSTAF